MAIKQDNIKLKGLNFGSLYIGENSLDISQPQNKLRRSPRLSSNKSNVNSQLNEITPFCRINYNDIAEKSIIGNKKLIKLDQKIIDENQESISDITLFVPDVEKFELINESLSKNMSVDADEFIFELNDIIVSPPGTRMKYTIKFQNDKIKFQNLTKHFTIKYSFITNLQIIPNAKSLAFILRISDDQKFKLGSVFSELIKIHINDGQNYTFEPKKPNELCLEDDNQTIPIEDIIIHVFQKNKYNSCKPSLQESFKFTDDNDIEIEDDEDEYDNLQCSTKNGTDYKLYQAGGTLIFTASPMRFLDLNNKLSQVLIQAFEDYFKKGKYKFNLTFKYENQGINNASNNYTLYGLDEEDASLLLSLLESKGINIKRIMPKDDKSKNKRSNKDYDRKDIDDIAAKTWGDGDKYQVDEFLVNSDENDFQSQSTDSNLYSTQYEDSDESSKKINKKMNKNNKKHN